MKLCTAQDRVLFLEKEIDILLNLIKLPNSNDYSLELQKNLSSILSELFRLKCAIDKTKSIVKFDEKTSMKEAELFLEQLEVRSVVMKTLSISDTKLYNQSLDVRKLIEEISGRLKLTSFTQDLVE